RLAADALAAGFDELLWVSPDVVFDSADADRLLAHCLPLVCGLYPTVAVRAFDGAFLFGIAIIQFCAGGVPTALLASGSGSGTWIRLPLPRMGRRESPRPTGRCYGAGPRGCAGPGRSRRRSPAPRGSPAPVRRAPPRP